MPLPYLPTPAPTLPVREVYIDETSQTKHRYLILGGITLLGEHSAALADEVSEARRPEIPNKEMRWGKVSKKKINAYKRVSDVFFDPPWSHLVQFHSLVVDTWQQNHKKFNEGNREVGFNKEIYQIIQKYRKLYPNCVFHIYPDERKTPQSTEELCTIVNNGAKKVGDERLLPFRRIHFRASHDCQLLQLTDVLLGALAYIHNGHDQAPNASESKKELAAYILSHAGIRDVFQDTAMRGKYTIWHRQLQK